MTRRRALPGETLPSRSEQRRGALEIFKLAETLATLGDPALASLPLTDELRDEVRRTRAVTSHIARKRQTQYLAKALRKLEESDLDPIRRVLEHDRAESYRESAVLQRIETWRERLIEEGDAALDALLALHPSADRPRLRALARSARIERERAKPPRSARELFRALRELFGDIA